MFTSHKCLKWNFYDFFLFFLGCKRAAASISNFNFFFAPARQMFIIVLLSEWVRETWCHSCALLHTFLSFALCVALIFEIQQKKMLHALNFFEHLFVFCLSSAAAPFIILLYSLSQQRCCCLSNYRHIIFYEFKDFSSGFSLAVVIFLKKSPDNRRNERKKYQI